MGTRREQMISYLEASEYTVKDLAALVRSNMRDTIDDLSHIQKSVGKRLQTRSAECTACNFVFRKRDRLNALRLHLYANSIPNIAHRLNQIGTTRINLDLLSQRQYMCIYCPRIINSIRPSSAQQIGAAQRLSFCLRQHIEQTKLLRRQIDKFTHIAHPPLY